jgi:hypothetical protein
VRTALRCSGADTALLAAVHARASELPALRAHRALPGAPGDDDPPRVVRVDPLPGARGVFRDAAVVLALSHPLEPSSLGAHSVRVLARDESLPGALTLSPDGAMVVWTPRRPLPPGVEHVLEVTGLRDRRGRPVATHRSGFVAGHHTLDDLLHEGTG